MSDMDLRQDSALHPEGGEPKYRIEAPIGQGGMGDVYLLEDRDLGRQVALKVLKADLAEEDAARAHFVAEAQATSQLEHPGVPPVHDLGVTADGRVYFTMKLIRGRTLREILHDLVLRRREVQREYNLHRLVSIVARIAETLHFAHERGVLHRDIKPENIMLGDYGEIHLVDWGLARVDRLPDGEDLEDAEQVATARSSEGLQTEHGSLKGTLAYMSPEQARGAVHDLDPRSEVFALGLVLYEILTLKPAFDPTDANLLAAVAGAEVPDVAERNPKRKIPTGLVSVVRRALQPDPADRFRDASAMGERLRAWLDGTSDRDRRHEEAERLAREGREAIGHFQGLANEAREAEVRVEEVKAGLAPHQPIEEKTALIAARACVKQKKREVALAFADATHLLNAALAQEQENPSARSALSDLWKDRLEDAEREGDAADAAHALAMIERYDDGCLAAFVAGDGSLSLTSEPPGAEVSVGRFEEQKGVLAVGEERGLGPTPIRRVGLPMGSYLCTLKHESGEVVRYPVHITRNHHWEGKVRLRTRAEIGDGFVYVPGGPYLYGEGRDARVVEVPDFAIQRFPVTFCEYGAFLQAIEAEEGREAARQRVPRIGSSDGEYMVRAEDGSWRPRPDLIEGDALKAALERFGPGFEKDIPVLAVSFHDAEAYCAWKTNTTGLTWRLPTELEREKAARGVDGRMFPWGDIEDASLGKCRESRAESTQPEPVGAFPRSASVYGMGDAAGGVWDWTTSWLDHREVLRVLRGGSWVNPPAGMRCAVRIGTQPSNRIADYGFRCARDL